MKLSLPKIDAQKLKDFSKKILQDKYEKILQDLRDLEIENPKDPRIKQKIAELLFKKEREDEALAKFKEIADIYEKDDFILKAINAYKNILKIKPDLVEMNLKLAALFIRMGMINEAAAQYRIAIDHYAMAKDVEKTLALSQQLTKIDPSNDNRAKLAEIYISSGLKEEAVKQYEMLAKNYRLLKDYDKLLHYDEMILPHQPENKAILKDVCILHLRNKRPERALEIMNHYKTAKDPSFEDLIKKARLMQEALKKHTQK